MCNLIDHLTGLIGEPIALSGDLKSKPDSQTYLRLAGNEFINHLNRRGRTQTIGEPVREIDQSAQAKGGLKRIVF